MLTAVVVADDESARRAERFPIGATITIDDLDAPGGEVRLERLREAEPISWLPQLGMWLATSHRYGRQVLSTDATTVEADANLVRESLGPMMLTSDGESHTRQRAPFDPAFRRSQVVARFEGAITEELGAIFDHLGARGQCEVAADIATPFVVGMAGRILGLSLEDARRINEFYEAFAGAMVYDGDDAPQRLADQARAELNGILRAELQAVRRHPNSSITSTVVGAEDPSLGDDEVMAQLRVIMFGAIETVQSAIMNTLYLLHEHPDQLASVRADPSLLGGACEEAMRLIPPVSFIERWVLEPIAFDGLDVGSGEFVGVSVLAANRDPAQFADPERFDVTRENAATNLSFSHGRHHCIGIHLARAQVVAAVERILGLPDVVVTRADPPSGFVFRRPATIELAWSSARPAVGPVT